MKTICYILVTLLFNAVCTMAQSASNLRCDEKYDPVGVDCNNVNFSWSPDFVRSHQGAYRIVVSSDMEKLSDGIYDLWDSGRVDSGKFVHVEYEGDRLDGNVKCYWMVKLWDESGNESAWSQIASFVTALNEDEWENSKWIAFEELKSSQRIVPGIHTQENHKGIFIRERAVVPYYRKNFEVSGDVAEAYLSICGLGHYEAYVNGIKVSSFLSPGWTHYDKRVLFNTYNVTDLIRKDKNVLSAITGNGFYYINNERYVKFGAAFGYPKMICVLKIKFSDGTVQNIISDNSWKVAESPISFSSIYGGEDYDSRKYDAQWNMVGFDDSGWKNALVVKAPDGALTPDVSMPIDVYDTIEPVDVIKVNDSCYTWDFGQNASGIINVIMRGNSGDTVRFWPGELLLENGRVNQNASGTPYYYEYIMNGDDREEWSPKFTYYGFRYVTVEGAVPDGINGDCAVISSIESKHTCSTSPKVGEFECSSPLMNDIYGLIDWAIRSNMQSVMTDCPHREKLGWLEQSYLMGNSIRYNYNIYHLYRKMVYDMMDSQHRDGLIPDIAPEFVKFSGGFLDSPEWGSAGVIVPWSLYRWYGDINILEEAYPMMRRYVAYLTEKAEGHLLYHGLGDWFDYGPNAPGEAQLTPIALTATAIYYYDIKILEHVAEILGDQKMVYEYSKLSEAVFDAFNKEFYDSQNKVYATGSQTSLAMPLCVGLVPESEVSGVKESLRQCIINGNYALTAGDIGFHFLVEALSADKGLSEMLFRMVNRTDVPGYGFQLAKGATSLTESWPALEVVSNNHLMLGHIMEWFYTCLLGINEAEGSIASDKVVLKPMVIGDLTWVKGSYNSPAGRIEVRWNKTETGLSFRCTIPSGIDAELIVPAGYSSPVSHIKLSAGNNQYFFEIQKD